MKTNPITRYLSLATITILALGIASPLTAQEAGEEKARIQPPAPLPLRPVAFPEYAERKLSNGAQLIVVEDHKNPLVTVSLRVRSGTAANPAGKVGVAEFTADLLNKGTKTRSAREIAESIDFVGGSLSAEASTDWTSISTTVLTEYLDTALDLLGDVVMNPTFPESEVELYRQQLLSALQAELGQPAQIASRIFLSEVYGDHPYGSSPTPESVKALARSDLEAFHKAHYQPGNTLIVVAGDVKADEIASKLDRAFKGWKGKKVPAAREVVPPARDAQEITLVHKPGSVQAVIRIGHLLPEATHQDWVTLDLVNQVLGGGTTGWLFRVLRSEKGYTYGAYSSASQRLGPGLFLATAEVRNEVVDSAMGDFFRLIDQLRDEPVPAEDLRIARDYMVGSFPLTIQTPQQVASQIAWARLLGLPADHLVRYRDQIAAIEAAELQRVAQELIRPDRAAVIIVGDANAILDMIEPFGPVRIVDVNGEPIELDDLEIGAADLSLDASKIEPVDLGYQITVQGSPIGQIETSVTREEVEGRGAVVVRTSGSGMISSEAEIAFDGTDLSPIYSRSQQQVGPQTVSIDLTAADGKITGQMTGPDGQLRDVDAEAVAGTLLPGMDEYVLWLIDFSSQTELQLPLFDGSSGGVIPASYKVVGETTVTVPAGEFEVYEIEATAGPMPLKIFVRKDGPHIVVRQEYVGQPIVVELTSVD